MYLVLVIIGIMAIGLIVVGIEDYGNN